MKRNCQDIEMHISEESLQYVEKYHSLTLITIPYDVADELYRVLDKAKENVRLVQWTPNQAEMVKEFALFSKSNSELERIQRVITQEAKGKGYNLHFVTFEDIPTQVAAKYNVRTSSKRLQLSFQDRVVSLLGVDTENFEKSYFISGQRLSETKLVELDGCFPFEQNGEKNVIANVSENILYITSFSPKLITGETAKCESNTKKEETSMSQGTNQFSLNAQGDIHFQISPKQVDFSGNNNMYAEASEGSTITQIRDNTPAPIDYEKVASVLNQIQKYEPTFLDECGEQRGAAQAALENAEEAVRTKDDSKLKKALQELKSFALGVGSSLVASGIVGLLKELPFLA